MAGARVSYTRAEAEAAIRASYSWSEALRRLGRCPTGGAHPTLKRYAEKWGIATDHFDPSVGRIQSGLRRRIPLEEVLVERSTFSRSNLKRRLYEAGLKERRCELCGQDEIWNGRRMSLIIDHVNGVRDDNRLENLRIVCPNCAATLDTHCGRNVPRERNCKRCGRVFEPRAGDRYFCSLSCAKQGANKGIAHPSRRKVERPSLAQLQKDLREMSFCAVGRKYGVSDNAVRKWLVWYERAAERECGEAA